MGLVYLPIFTYIYHNKIQSNATIHAGKYTNPNGMGPGYSFACFR